VGGRLSKSRADKYIHKLFEEHWEKNNINPKDFKPKKDGSVPPERYIMNGQLTINYDKMKDSHKEVAERQIKKLKIKSASELIAKASIGMPEVFPKVGMNLTPEQEELLLVNDDALNRIEDGKIENIAAKVVENIENNPGVKTLVEGRDEKGTADIYSSILDF